MSLPPTTRALSRERAHTSALERAIGPALSGPESPAAPLPLQDVTHYRCVRPFAMSGQNS